MNYDGHLNGDVPVPEGGFALLNSFADNGSQRSVTSVEFDTYEELLWTGNHGGHVVSHYSPAADKYSAFRTNVSGTNALSVTNNSVVSIARDGIFGNKKEGLSLFRHMSHNLTELSCIHPMPNAPQTVIVGGHQQKIVQFDIETQKEQRVVHLKQQRNCTIIRSNDKLIYSSDTDGKIAFRNPNTIEAVMAIDAHQGYISDFDICENSLITCGCGISNRHNMFSMDMFIKVFDLRTSKLRKHINLAFCPVFCRFIPSSEPKIVAVSRCGQLQVIDLNADIAHDPMQIETTFGISALGVSPSKQCIAIGDDGGFVHLFSDRADPVFVENAIPTEFFHPEELATHISITDSVTPLSIIGLPIACSYMSDWPPFMVQRVPREPDVISNFTLESVRQNQFIGYTRNPRANTPLAGFNVIPYSNVRQEQAVLQQENMMFSQSFPGLNDAQRTIRQFTPTINKLPEIPNCYLNQSKAPRGGQWTNKSEFVLISENDISVPYLNAILTVLYHVLPVRNVFLQHLCYDEHCLSCQIGFLYRVLTDKKPYFNSATPSSKQVYLASSGLVVQSLKTIEEASAIEKLGNGEKCETRICKQAGHFLRFLIEHVRKELENGILQNNEYVENLGNILKLEYTLNTRCFKCFGDSTTDLDNSATYVLSLIYPEEDTLTPLSFSHLIEHSLLKKDKTAAIQLCPKCSKHAPTSFTRRIRTLPPVLLIDTNISDESVQAFWTFQLKHSERRPAANQTHAFGVYEASSPGRKPCRYGYDCRLINCKFSHPTHDTHLDVSNLSPALRTTQSLPDLREWSHYLAPTIYVSHTKEGVCSVSETATGEANIVAYHLLCSVMSIGMTSGTEETTSSHLVSQICIGPRSNTPSEQHKNWVVVNDEAAMKVDEHTALHLDMRWKRPVMFAYVQSDHPYVKNLTEKRTRVPMEVFWHGENLAGDNAEVSKITLENIPKEGDVIGIDAEFIELNQADPNKKSPCAGRVSCINAEGCVLIDDYIRIHNSAVRDYVTRYSGIVEGDLDPLTSLKYLTTQKYTYMKILYLIEQKVTFVGHALDNDFGVLKLFAPHEQRRDSALVFHQAKHRMISLQFLAWHFFGERIQEKEHCSVEDARMALRLCTVYEDLKKKGELEEAVEKLYASGAKMGWKGDSSTPPPILSNASDENEEGAEN